jgi:hypothetical protein
MKNYKWILAALLAVGGMAVAPAAAQTRVSVSVGFGVPNPYVSGYVVVGRPRYSRYHRPYYGPYYYRYHRRPSLVIGRPEVIVVPRRPYHRRHHRGRH